MQLFNANNMPNVSANSCINCAAASSIFFSLPLYECADKLLLHSGIWNIMHEQNFYSAQNPASLFNESLN